LPSSVSIEFKTNFTFYNYLETNEWMGTKNAMCTSYSKIDTFNFSSIDFQFFLSNRKSLWQIYWAKNGKCNFFGDNLRLTFNAENYLGEVFYLLQTYLKTVLTFVHPLTQFWSVSQLLKILWQNKAVIIKNQSSQSCKLRLVHCFYHQGWDSPSSTITLVTSSIVFNWKSASQRQSW
jgi:hypothetical protein